MSTPAPAAITPQASKGTLIRRLSSLEVQPKSELRGVRLRQLLWPFGAAGRRFRRIINPADDSAAIAVPTIDCFISHAWADAWPLKYVALIYHFHADGAAACVVVLVFFAFFVENSLPELLPSGWPLWIPRASELDGSTHYVPQLCYFVAVVSFLPLMLLGRFVRDRVCFFDACCVPQDDTRQKAAGIESLGAIVSRSERLVVLVDENTFTRLWCLFEVASFYRRAGGSGRIDFVPLHTALRELTFFALIAVTLFGAVNATRPGAQPTAVLSSYEAFRSAAPLAFLLFLFAALKAKRSAERIRALRSFSLDAAQCSSAEDKAALLAVVGDWYADAHAGEAEPDRLIQLGHRSFEAMVRHELAPLLEKRANQLGSGAFERATLTLWLPRMLDWVASPTVTLQHAAFHVVAYVWYALGIFCLVPAAADVCVDVCVASAAVARRHLGSLGERARLLLLLPAWLVLAYVAVSLSVAAVFEGVYVFIAPKMIANGGAGEVAALRALHDRHAKLRPATDGLDDATRALYKQQAVVLLLLAIATAAIVGRSRPGRA